MKEHPKARENGGSYTLLTAQNAAAADRVQARLSGEVAALHVWLPVCGAV